MIGSPILQLMDSAFGGPFLFAVRRSSREDYDVHSDAYIGYYNDEVGTVIVSKNRSDVILGCDDEFQYYYVQGSKRSSVARSNMASALVGRNFWYRWCREFGLHPDENLEEKLERRK